MERMTHRGEVLFSNGYTYSGHPVSCAAALKNIEILERDNVLAHVRDISPYFQERLARLTRYPIIGDARGAWLIGCIEARLSKNGSRLEDERKIVAMIDQACHDRGLIVRPLINMCVFSPPLVISRTQVNYLFDILEQAIEAVCEKFDLTL